MASPVTVAHGLPRSRQPAGAAPTPVEFLCGTFLQDRDTRNMRSRR